MKSFPYNVVGPDIEKSDLVFFDFGDSQLSLRLPEKTEYEFNCLATQKISDIPEEQWSSGSRENFRHIELIHQRWYYFDARSENHVLLSTLTFSLLQLSTSDEKKNIILSKTDFPAWLLQNLHINARARTDNPEEHASALEDWQVPKSLDDIERIVKPHLSWLVATDGHIGMGPPERTAYIPISNQYVLFVYLFTEEMLQSDEPRRIPKDEMQLWNHQIFLDFLNNMTLTYSPQTIALIESLE